MTRQTGGHFAQHNSRANFLNENYPQTSNINSALAGNKTVDHSVVESPVGAAPPTYSFST